MHSFQQPYYEHLTFFFLVIFTKLPATEKVLIMSDLFILLFVYVSNNLHQYCQCPGFLSGTEDPGLLLAVWGEPADCTSTQQHKGIRHKVMSLCMSLKTVSQAVRNVIPPRNTSPSTPPTPL